MKLVVRGRLLHVSTIRSRSGLQRPLVIFIRIPLRGWCTLLLHGHVRIHSRLGAVSALHIHGLLLVSHLVWILPVLISIVHIPRCPAVHHISVRLRRVPVLAIHTEEATSLSGIVHSCSTCSGVEKAKQVPYSLIG